MIQSLNWSLLTLEGSIEIFVALEMLKGWQNLNENMFCCLKTKHSFMQFEIKVSFKCIYEVDKRGLKIAKMEEDVAAKERMLL